MTSSRSLSPAITLSQFVEAYVVPAYLVPKGRDAKTVAEYRSAARRWAEVTGDPPLKKIDQRTCAAFVASDLAKPGRRGARLSPNTAIKHCTHLQMILDLAGPQSRERPEAVSRDGLFGRSHGVPNRSPWLVKPAVKAKPPEDCFGLDELRRWIAVCDQARRPRGTGVAPGDWWRALIRVLYQTDLRIGSALALRRDWITPVDQAGGAVVDFPGEAYKGGGARSVFLSAAAWEIVRGLGTGPVVFPWSQTRKTLDAHRQVLLEAAGIPESRRFGFHAIRKCGLSELALLDLEAAGRQAGHKSLATTVQHYLRPSARGQVMAQQMGELFARMPEL